MGGCRGGGVKTSLRIMGVVCGFGPRSRATFFLYMDPLTHGGGPGPQLQVPPVAPPLWALASEDLTVFTLDKAVSRHLQDFQKFDFFGNPSVAPGMGLGDDLVTIRVLEHPWGPTQWLPSPYSPSHGPSKSPEIAIVQAVS